jgi:hypothetical protein
MSRDSSLPQNDGWHSARNDGRAWLRMTELRVRRACTTCLRLLCWQKVYVHYLFPDCLSARANRRRLLMVDCQIVPDQTRSNHLDLVELYARRMSLTAANRKLSPEVHDSWSSIEFVHFGRPMPEPPLETEQDATEQIEPVVLTPRAPVGRWAPLEKARQAALQEAHVILAKLTGVLARCQPIGFLINRD